MILVVYSHVLFFGGVCDYLSVSSIVTNIRMPLFFFISGYLSYAIYDKSLFVKRFKNRIFNQLLPTISTLAVFCIFFSKDMLQAYLSEAKLGYWFTYVLFITFAICVPSLFLLDRYRVSKRCKCAVLVALALISLVLYINVSSETNLLFDIFSIRYLLRYLSFYVFGILARMYNEFFLNLISKHYVAAVCLILLTILYYLDSRMLIVPYAICGIIAAFYVFSRFDVTFSSRTILGKAMMFVGKNTLPVYFIHYFLLPYVLQTLSFIPMDMLNDFPLLGFVVVAFYSLITTALCLAVQRLIMFCKPLYYLLFGSATYYCGSK